MLSIINSVYDPLGLVAPVGTGWDDIISGVLSLQWQKWLEDLWKLEKNICSSVP